MCENYLYLIGILDITVQTKDYRRIFKSTILRNALNIENIVDYNQIFTESIFGME